MSGKEHFDKWVPDYCKAENVFDHSFYFWATTEYFLPPSGKFQRPFYLEGRKIGAEEIEYEISPMYKTDFITDYALKWLDEAFGKEKEYNLPLIVRIEIGIPKGKFEQKFVKLVSVPSACCWSMAAE